MANGRNGKVLVKLAPELADLVPCYLANRFKDTETLAAALERGDFEAIGRIGHNLHGSGTSFGLDRLSLIGVAIERAAKVCDWREIGRQLQSMKDYLSRLEIEKRAAAGPQYLPEAIAAAGTEADDRAVDVLLVDDQEMNIAILSRYLTREGYRVRSLNSGEAALAALAAPPPPGLVLLDVVMGGLDGIEICRRIKSNPATRGIPVVFVSSAKTGCDRIRGRAAGADDFLAKPVHRETLIERVRSLLPPRAAAADGTAPQY